MTLTLAILCTPVPAILALFVTQYAARQWRPVS